jgi:hypothetical protein
MSRFDKKIKAPLRAKYPYAQQKAQSEEEKYSSDLQEPPATAQEVGEFVVKIQLRHARGRERVARTPDRSARSQRLPR